MALLGHSFCYRPICPRKSSEVIYVYVYTYIYSYLYTYFVSSPSLHTVTMSIKHLIWRGGRSGNDRWQLLKFEMPRYDNSKLTGEARWSCAVHALLDGYTLYLSFAQGHAVAPSSGSFALRCWCSSQACGNSWRLAENFTRKCKFITCRPHLTTPVSYRDYRAIQFLMLPCWPLSIQLIGSPSSHKRWQWKMNHSRIYRYVYIFSIFFTWDIFQQATCDLPRQWSVRHSTSLEALHHRTQKRLNNENLFLRLAQPGIHSVHWKTEWPRVPRVAQVDPVVGYFDVEAAEKLMGFWMPYSETYRHPPWFTQMGPEHCAICGNGSHLVRDASFWSRSLVAVYTCTISDTFGKLA